MPPKRALGPTSHDPYDSIEHPVAPAPSSTATAPSTVPARDASERTALLGRTTSRDYHTEARRDARALERDPELVRAGGGGKRPYSLRIDFALAVLLLLANGYFWTMSLAGIKGQFVANTGLPAHRGSMFLPVWISFLGCTINTASLLSFLFPHESPHLSFYTSLLSSFFALLTLILCLSVTQLRTIEGPLVFILLALSIASSLHAALSAALTDKYAPILDPPEELDPDYEEPTGAWAKVKRAVRKGLGFLGISLPIAAAHVAVLAVFVMLSVNVMVRAVDSSVEQAGQRWKVLPSLWSRKYFPELAHGAFQSKGREYRVHLSCRGLALDDPPVLSTTSATTNSSLLSTTQGRPTVRRTILLESEQGIPAQTDAAWVLRMLKDGELASGDVETRICWWDRPGYGWSDASPSSSTPHLAAALTQALSVSGELARLEPPPSLDSAAPSPLARSGLVLISRGRSTALTSLFSTLHPRLIHSFLYIQPSSPSLTFSRQPVTRFAAFPHFFTQTLPAVWSELGVKRVWWALKGVSRKRRVLAREGEGVSGLIERAGLQEQYESDRGRDSDGAKAWERRKGRYPTRPTVVLGMGRDKADQGRRFVEDVVGEGLREWDEKWKGGVEGCNGGGREEEKCREVLRGLVHLD
ncbi:hypothetical protein JCM8547_001983 [Rhodosporidiobolus lusitaniae]